MTTTRESISMTMYPGMTISQIMTARTKPRKTALQYAQEYFDEAISNSYPPELIRIARLDLRREQKKAGV